MTKKAKIIDFHEASDYDRVLLEAMRYLDYQLMDICDHIIDLATKGKWKEWDESLEMGEEFIFTDDMIRDTGDKNVDMLLEVHDAMADVRERLALKNKRVAQILEKENGDDWDEI